MTTSTTEASSLEDSILQTIADYSRFEWTEGDSPEVLATLNALIKQGKVFNVGAIRKDGSRLLTREYILVVQHDYQRPDGLIGEYIHLDVRYNIEGDSGDGIETPQYRWHIFGGLAPEPYSPVAFRTIIGCGKAARYQINKALGLISKDDNDDDIIHEEPLPALAKRTKRYAKHKPA